MEDGAFGISTHPRDVTYPEELIELCKVVARYGGILDVHLRSNTTPATSLIIDSMKEAIMIAEKSGVITNLAHLRNSYECGGAEKLLRFLTEARQKGVEITCDIFPWNYSMVTNPVSLFLPGGLGLHGHDDAFMTLKEVLDQFRDEDTWEKLKNEMEKTFESQVRRNKEDNENLRKHGVILAWQRRHPRYMRLVHSKTHPEYIGMTLDETADELGLADWSEAIRQIMLDDEGETRVSLGFMYDKDILPVLTYPWCAIETGYSSRDFPAPTIRPSHPRGYGTFPRVLGKYVREEKALSLEDAVRKMTSLPATWLGPKDRALIRDRFKADIVIFDPDRINSTATYEAPDRYPEGIEYVIVNGKVVLDHDKHTGILPGKVLKHQAYVG